MYNLPELEKSTNIKAIAVMTSGGDSPGMNPAVRAITRSALNQGLRVFGINRGYSGLIIGDIFELKSTHVTNIIQRGGTILKSDRCPAFKDPVVRNQAAEILKKHEIDGLIVIGGDGSLTGAHYFTQETGIPVIGLPGTIDNDIYGTDDSIGFDTVLNTALDAIDRIRDTAVSHERIFLVEVMGRNSGHIASQVGIASGAEMIIVPEVDFKLETLCFSLASHRAQSKGGSGIIVVAEGPAPGLTYRLAKQLESHGEKPGVSILGYIQRGGRPTGHDRVLASCLGASAVTYLMAGFTDIMVGVINSQITTTPLQDIVEKKKPLNPDLVELAQLLHK
ncbi:6-phosphofructokinase [Amphritea japonica]|uniref:ATP-dependent 6-phosphofructokinase n=1 Tax=Amphritea japonica ATCC BAA-1530 TaxID=1278309 RepID=A0A7R6SRQ6_9GAMM|nr:6-phosphofructokinase [Amphritea japonica]BBB25426.1 6-phosphofructokinase 1 [Amphritea japonica ATCC BAA-1530]